MEYENKTDNELIALSQKGDTEAITIILEKYKGLVKRLARSMFLVGGDTDDLVQEGTLGILKAIETFNGKSSFSSYVYLCVKSKMLSLIKKDNSK
ncbi:MAG: sigma-70 family RNA polymerase sigma factor, partial [Firmicutes bacterium]|nr:sigma-70 family RNA polymerase sigma factor [Candidatus Caballimonas caccae]